MGEAGERKGWKAILGMGACCAGPILLIAAIPLFGGSLGGVASAALPWIAILACPAGMYFMMRYMQHGAHRPLPPTEVPTTTPMRLGPGDAVTGPPSPDGPPKTDELPLLPVTASSAKEEDEVVRKA